MNLLQILGFLLPSFGFAVISVVATWVFEEFLGAKHGRVDGEDGGSGPRMLDAKLHSN